MTAGCFLHHFSVPKEPWIQKIDKVTMNPEPPFLPISKFVDLLKCDSKCDLKCGNFDELPPIFFTTMLPEMGCTWLYKLVTFAMENILQLNIHMFSTLS